jgi:hypothetical protein
MSKIKSIGGAIERALVGSESLSPELKQFTEKYIYSTGRAKHLPGRKSKILNFAIGPEGAANILKARYAQGGIFGPGGLILGEMAPSQEYLDLIRNIGKSSDGLILDPGTGRLISKKRAVAKAIGKTPLEALNPAFLLGFPAYDVYSSLNAKPGDDNYGAKGVGTALGSGLGFILGAPLGLVGGLGISHIGSSLGGRLGNSLSKTPVSQTTNTLEDTMKIEGKDVAYTTAKALFDAYNGSNYN